MENHCLHITKQNGPNDAVLHHRKIASATSKLRNGPSTTERWLSAVMHRQYGQSLAVLEVRQQLPVTPQQYIDLTAQSDDTQTVKHGISTKLFWVQFKKLHIWKCNICISSSACFARYGSYTIQVRWTSYTYFYASQITGSNSEKMVKIDAPLRKLSQK